MAVTLRLDDTGRIKESAHQTSACVLAQASASILGKHLHGADAASVRELRTEVGAMLDEGAVPAPPFQDYAALKGAAVYRNRHTCVLLPIDAVLDALGASKLNLVGTSDDLAHQAVRPASCAAIQKLRSVSARRSS